MARKTGIGLDHISLMLSKIEDGIRFFNGYLGFPIVTDVRDADKEVVVLRAGRIHIELWQRDRCSSDNKTSIDKRPLYLNHLAFEVKDIVGTLEELREAGYPVIEELYSPTDGVREAVITGPDGIQVQLVEQNISKLVWRSVSGSLKRDRGMEQGDQEESSER